MRSLFNNNGPKTSRHIIMYYVLGIWSLGAFLCSLLGEWIGKRCQRVNDSPAWQSYTAIRKRYKKLDIVFAILGIVLYIGLVDIVVRKYAIHFEKQVLVVNAICLTAQKVGVAGSMLILILYCLIRQNWELENFRLRDYPLVWLAFGINRIGSLIPPVYLLAIAWQAFPWFIKAVLFLDIGLAVVVVLQAEAWVRTAALTVKQWRQERSLKTVQNDVPVCVSTE